MLIKRLYSEPRRFEPVEFEEGLNVILGEKDLSSAKNNGVGKSLCIEFLNFALLKNKSDSRVARIPAEVFDPETLICVDFQVGQKTYTIRRSLSQSERPELIEPKGVVRFDRIDHAVTHLSILMFPASEEHPTFREMLGPLIRDERSEFKTLAGCYDTERRAADNYRPHLYLFGIDMSPYDDLKTNSTETSNRQKERKGIEENVKLVSKTRSIKEARADMNGLQAEIDLIAGQIERLENTAGYEIIKDDIMALELKIDEARRRRSVVTASLQRLKPISSRVELDESDVRDFFDQLKSGLGTLVSRDLNQVLGFKAEIDRFQELVLSERVSKLDGERKALNKELDALEKSYRSLLSVLDQEGSLRNLRQTYAAHRAKSDAAGQLKAFIAEFERLNLEIQRLKSQRESLVTKMLGSVVDASDTVISFERTMLQLHEFVQGNRRASFNIEVSDRKQVIDLVMRIDDDGSHSIEREKVFMYDYSLLTNTETARRHPGFLVHDNVFEVDQDTLEKSIRYVLADPGLADRQYILTVNSDRVEQNPDLMADLKGKVRARFTKAERFLETSYQEIR